MTAPGGSRSRRLAVGWGIASVLAVALGLVATLAAEPAAAAKPKPGAPNVIVVMTDDQPSTLFNRRLMPKTFKALGRSGTRFKDYLVSTPLCCPSRAAFSTGQYGHNNGVLANTYGALADHRNVLPTWLVRAGYKTIHLGRFYNGYEGRGRAETVAPGWKIWRTTLAPRRYYDYTMRRNRSSRTYGSADGDHLTGVLNRIAVRAVRRFTPRRRPIYLQLDHLAPHVSPSDRTGECRHGAVPAPAEEDALASMPPLPRPPSFNEAEIGDKPSFMRQQPRLGADRIAAVEGLWRCAAASLASVDRGVARIWKELGRAHTRRETVIVFTSDNGLHYGEHRLANEKLSQYTESLRVPLIVRVPPRLRDGKPRRRSRAPAINVDLAPTILELTGAKPCRRASGCRVLDGRSLVGELGRDARRATRIRRDRERLLELDAPRQRTAPTCAFAGVRTRREILIRHTLARTEPGGECVPVLEREHYDLRNDPFELRNLAAGEPGSAERRRIEELDRRIDELSRCAGVEGRDPLPPSGFWCD